MSTRHQVLELLKRRGRLDVATAAEELGLTTMGVRRHLDALAAAGLVDVEEERRPVGRPARSYRLSAEGEELFPRRYDTLALQVLEDLEETGGREAVDALFERRAARLTDEYRAEMGTEMPEAIAALARIRDEAGYLCDWREDEDGGYLLVEANCAVRKVAEKYPKVCALELKLFRDALGDGVTIDRETHIVSGDTTCTYRIRKRRD